MNNNKVKVRRWTNEDKEFLIENKDMPLAKVVIALDRSINAVKSKRKELGLKREKIKDLKGQRFSRLTVIKENGRIGRRVAWLCKCDCGNETTVSSNHLLSGDTKSCGCYSRDIVSETNSKDLTNQKFGYLTVIRQNGRTKTQQIKWLCECVCGNKTTVISNNLINSNTESCGCKRELNQRQGLAWEELVKRFLSFKYTNFDYHVRLPNLKIPDFYILGRKIILDAKRHDYLMIDDCIKKYSPFSDKIIFICMEKRRKDWQIDFENGARIEFWYPYDLLTWIPKQFQNEFLKEVKKIEKMGIKEKKQEKFLNIQKAIQSLEKDGKPITQETVAKKMGTGKNIFRERKKLAEFLKSYNNVKTVEFSARLLDLIEKMAIKQLHEQKKATQLGIAKLINENYPKLLYQLLYNNKEPPLRKIS